jgi:predicted transport protein
MLLIDGVRYRLWTPSDEEKEFHPMVKEHSKEIFGESSLYFDVKHMLKSRSGIGSIPDAYVITLSKPCQWYIVENELATHRVYEHVVPQVTRFISGIENLSSEREIRDALYKEINENKVLKTYVEKLVEPEEVHAFLSTLTSRPPKIAIVIDKVTDEINEAVASLKRLGDAEVVEFRTYVRENGENVHAHVFEPLSVSAVVHKVARATGERKPLPEQYQSWAKMFAWVNPDTRGLTTLVEGEIISTLGDTNGAARGRYYCFFRGRPSTKSIFAVFLLTKGALKIRIRTGPATFKDPENWTRGKVYKGWFYKQGQEKEFTLTSADRIPYAMKLIRQSYELAQ